MKHIVLKLISLVLCMMLFSQILYDIPVAKAEIISKSDAVLPEGSENAKLIYSQSDFSSAEYSSPRAGAVDEFFRPTDGLWSVEKTDSERGTSLSIGRDAYWTLADAFSKNGTDTIGSVHQISFDFKNTNQGHIYFYFCTVGNVRLNKGGLHIADGTLLSVQDRGYSTYGTLSLNQWYNIKFTYDSNTDIAYVSLNDVIIDSYSADFKGELYSILFQRNDGTKAYIDNINYTVWNNKYDYGVMRLTGSGETHYKANLLWMAKEDEKLCLIIASYSDKAATKMTSSSYAILDVSEGENNLTHTHTDKDSVTAKAFLWRQSQKFLVPVMPCVSLDNTLEIDSELPLELTFDNTDETSYAGCDIQAYNGNSAMKINASTIGEVEFDSFVKGDYVISFDIASLGVFNADLTIYGGGTPISLLEFDTEENIKTKKGNIISSYDSEYTTITLVYDADAYTFDIYADEELIIKKYYPAAAKTDKCVTFSFDFDSDEETLVYLDNIFVYPTYMHTSKCFIHDPWASPEPEMKAVVPATETWFSDETDEIEFMKDMVSFHKRSGLVCAYGKKFTLSEGFYEKNDEIMVPSDFFTTGYELNVTKDGNYIYIGDNIRLSLTGNTMKVGNINYGLSSPPEEKEGTIYLPLKAIVTKGLSKNMYSDFDTIHSGLIVFSDKKATFPKGDALQRLNDYCFYERPTAERWLSDYNKSPLKGVHPRVMATKEDFERIKEEIKTNSHKKRLYDKLISYCNSKMNKSPLKYELRDGVRLMYVSDDFMNWVISYAFAYQITGDVTYFNAAWKQIEAVSQMPDWNPVHHIDVGIMALGYGIAYDWFYDIMSEEQRNIMEKCVYNNLYWIVNEAFKSLDTPYEDPGMKDNHNVYCNAGLVACIVAFMDVYPDIGSHLGAGTMRLLERFMHLFAPYGSYFEGPSYASVSINYTTRLFASMKETMGTLYGLDKAEAFDLSGDYIINMQSDVASFGFGDGDSGLKECVGTFWIYDHYGIKGRHETLVNTLYGANGADAVSALLYYDVDDTPLESDNVKLDYYYPGEDIIVSRNNYDLGQVFVGMKLGGTLHSHSHLDFGSFVFDSDGKRWAHDLGADDYNLEYNWGFYDIFRRRPESHNTLLINPDSSYGFDLKGRANLISYESGKSGLIAKTDMTSLYGNKVTSAKRGFFFTDNRQSLVVRDEVTLTNDADLYWLMYIDSNMEYIGNNTVLLTDKRYTSKKLKIEFSSSEGETVIGTEAAVPFPDSPQIPEQNSNYGYKRLYYKVRGSGNVDITVKITPYNVDGTPLSDYNINMDNWSLVG